MVFDWAGLIPRHRGQVTREQDLRMGEVYARVRTWGAPVVNRIKVDKFVFVGTYSGATESDITDHLRDKGWLHKRCLSLHADGWVDRYDKANSPTAAIWDSGRLINLAFADTMFGLGDVSDNNEHSVVIPAAGWHSHPELARVTAGVRCPDCKGVGTITLLTSSVPCGCRASASE